MPRSVAATTAYDEVVNGTDPIRARGLLLSYDPRPVTAFTATYHDTADRRLTRADIALRRRMQNGVGVWEAEIAGDVIAEPGGPANVPERIRRALIATLRDAELLEVARIRTADDAALLEGQHVLRTYDDERAALHDTVGARRSPKRREPALEHVRAYFAAQLGAIERTDPVLRLRDDVEALHDFRVAVRRLRASLRAARDLFEEDWACRLRDELRWLGGELGPARDLDVLLEHLRAERPDVGFDAAPIIKRFERDRKAARKRVVAALESDRYLEVVDQVRVAVDHPPVRDVDVRLRKVAKREYEKLADDVARLGATPTDDALHRVRIRIKRARYAAELAALAGVGDAKFVKQARRLQNILGAHQDAVVAETRLRAFAESADAAFGAGRLVERQRRRRADARDELPRAWKRLRKRARKAWA